MWATEHQQYLDSLPSDWDTTPIGDLGEVVAGGTPSRFVAAYWGGEIPWTTPSEVTQLSTKWLNDTVEHITQAGLDASAAVLLPPRSLLVTTRATIGAVAMNAAPVATNQGFKNIVPGEGVNADFYYHVLRFVAQEFARLASGSTFTEIQRREFVAARAPAPSEPEQERIAGVLDLMDETISKTEELIAKLKAVKTGLLHDLLTRGFDENGQLRDPDKNPEQFRQSPLGTIPRAWSIGAVKDYGEVLLGRQRSPKHQSGLHTTPYLRVANVFDGWIDYSDVLSMDFTSEEKQTFWLQPGDILLNEGQSLELVGRCAVFTGPPETFCFQNTLIRFRASGPNQPWFFRALFKRCLDTGLFSAIARQTTSVAHLGADRLARMPVAVPGGPEQEAIASKLAVQDQKIATEQGYLSKLRSIKKGLMQDLLSGHVRVPAEVAG